MLVCARSRTREKINRNRPFTTPSPQEMWTRSHSLLRKCDGKQVDTVVIPLSGYPKALLHKGLRLMSDYSSDTFFCNKTAIFPTTSQIKCSHMSTIGSLSNRDSSDWSAWTGHPQPPTTTIRKQNMLSLFRPAPHIDRLPADKVDPFYKRMRWQVFFGIFFGYAGYYGTEKLQPSDALSHRAGLLPR